VRILLARRRSLKISRMRIKIVLFGLLSLSLTTAATLQSPHIHDLPEDQLAVESGPERAVVMPPPGFLLDSTPSARVRPSGPLRTVVAPPSEFLDRTPAARVRPQHLDPAPADDDNDAVVVRGEPAGEEGDLSFPVSGPVPLSGQPLPGFPYGAPWWMSGVPIILLQPIIVQPVTSGSPAAPSTPSTRRLQTGLEYYGAAVAPTTRQEQAPLRYYGAAATRNQQRPLSLRDLLRRVYAV